MFRRPLSSDMNRKHEPGSDRPGDRIQHHSTDQSLSSTFINSIISSSGNSNSNVIATNSHHHQHYHQGTKSAQSVPVQPAVKWNITNSAQNIVSALVDPSKQYDYAFRREWSNTFSSGPTGIPSSKLLKSSSAKTKKDAELRSKLKDYLVKLEERQLIKKRESLDEANRSDHFPPEGTTSEDKLQTNPNRQVPDIFMQDHLDLSDLETFTKILNLIEDDEQIKNDSPTYHRYAFNKFQLRQLQKKFTDYLDIIEENLAGQISNRSGDFFQVMSSVDSVMDEISLAIKSVTSLRKKCATLNSALILPNLRNIQLTKSRNNADEVLTRLNTISTLCKVQSKIQLLLASSDFVGALNLIAKSRRLLEDELVGVVCLRHLESQLNEVERVIGTMMQQEYVTLITSEWNRPVATALNGNNLDLDYNLPDNPDAKLFEHERVLSIVQGMIRINRLNFGEYFQQEARIAISTCVKQTLIEFLSDEDDCIGSDDKVSHDVFKTVQLINYTRVILSSLDQVDSFLSIESPQNNESPDADTIIPEVFQMLDINAKQRTLNNVRQGKNGLQSSFQAVCNFANQLTVNLIECRIKESNFDKLLATEFINLSKLIEDFTRGFSDICDRNQTTLRLLLQTQADKFVNKFHDERKKRIKSNLDIEQWKMVEEVPHDFRQIITSIVDDNIPIWQCLQAEETKGDQVNETNQKKAYIVANNQNYVIVNSAINLIRMIIDYCRCANDIKFLSSELLARLFELLQLYNSTTYQLVYSAGALQVAGLKTITARNLVVSQRSLKLILLVLPSIRQHFDRLLPDDHRSMLKRFDEIGLTYRDHASKIPERVTSIVKDVINLQLQEWEAKPPVPSPQFCAVSQHLMRLHDNIQDAIPLEELKVLFLKIHLTFKEVLRSHLIRLKIANDSGPQQWLVTQELAFYKMNSVKLSVFKSVDLDFDDLWSNLNAST